MMRLLIVLGALALPAFLHADSQETSTTQVTGQFAVDNTFPQATMHVLMDPSQSFALKVSSASSAAVFAVTSAGNVGIGLGNPQGHLDVGGAGDTSGDIGLQLRVGNSSSTVLSQQIIFATTGGLYPHAIVTQHESDQAQNNSINFLLWNSTGQPTAPASLPVMNLEALYTSTASMHVDPVGVPDAELVVSNGLSTGGGTIIRAAAGPHSSRSLKEDIVYFDDTQRRQAYEDVKSLKHATYQYRSLKSGQPAGSVRRGLIYEDAPESIHGFGKTIVLDYRVLNLEMALQETDKRIVSLENKIAELEKKKKGAKK